ncbi:hypothetical protein CIW51_05420 [Mycolicibacterium sp. P9-22]|nr:hypothetical protein CIW51_05420 [Mycolicibacterium sp. P9-22]
MQIADRLGGQGGLFAADVEEFDIGASGVLAAARPLGFAMTQQDQPVLVDAHRGDSAARGSHRRIRVPG